MREVLLHGGSDEGFDRSVAFARQLADSFGAKLDVLYTVEDPLSAGWTAELSPERLPEIHQAIEQEARERLARVISLEDQDRLGVTIAIAVGPAADEIVRFVEAHPVDLAVIQVPAAEGASSALADALLTRTGCAVLVLR